MVTASPRSFPSAVHLEQERVEASEQNGIFYYKGQAVMYPRRIVQHHSLVPLCKLFIAMGKSI